MAGITSTRGKLRTPGSFLEITSHITLASSALPSWNFPPPYHTFPLIIIDSNIASYHVPITSQPSVQRLRVIIPPSSSQGSPILRSEASFTMPRSSVFTGSLKLAVPEHSAYRQAREEQKKIATNMVVCRGGRLPTFSADAVPTVSEWDRHRIIAEGMIAQERVHRKVQRTPANTYGNPGARGLSDVLSIPPIGGVIIKSLWKSDAASIGSLAATSKKCSDAVSLYVVSSTSQLWDIFLILTAYSRVSIFTSATIRAVIPSPK